MGDMQKMYKCPDCGYQSLTYSDSAHLCWMPGWIKKQADIISTPEDLQADDAAVSALMMESDITAPIKEQCEENARLMREVAELKRIVDVLKMDNMRLERKLDAAAQDKQVAQIKAEKYDAAVSVLAELINDLRG